MCTAITGEQITQTVATAFEVGPASRTDLLAAAVAAQAANSVFDALLNLPERRFRDVRDLGAQLDQHR